MANQILSGFGFGKAAYGIGSAAKTGYVAIQSASQTPGISLLSAVSQASGGNAVVTAAEVAQYKATQEAVKKVAIHAADEGAANIAETVGLGMVAVAAGQYSAHPFPGADTAALYVDALGSGKGTLNNLYSAFDRINRDLDLLLLNYKTKKAEYKAFCCGGS